MKESDDFSKLKLHETFQQFVPVKTEAKHSYIPQENIQGAQFDRFSEANSSLRAFSPNPYRNSPSFSHLTPSIANSPINPLSKIPKQKAFEVKETQKNDAYYRQFNPNVFQTKPELFLNSNSKQILEKSNLYPPIGTNPARQKDQKIQDYGQMKNGRHQFSTFGEINSDQGSVDNQNDSDEEGNNEKKKLNKGLKLLSVIVRDIVIEKQSTTYKEVAEIILRDTIRDEQLNMSHKTEILKEEQNIKRRVYDALNVLISAGILIKEGKKVRKNDNILKVKVNFKRSEINSMISKLVS